MSEFSPPNPSTYYGEDLESATASFNEKHGSDSLELPMLDKINDMEPDEFNYTRLSKEDIPLLRAELEKLGILSQPPSETDLKAMRDRARELVSANTAKSFLLDQEKNPFMPISAFYSSLNQAEASKKIVSWKIAYEDTHFYVNPDTIIAGGSYFTSWAGGPGNKTRKTADGRSVEGSTWSAIEEYADKYDTQLPPLEATALNVVVTDSGAYCSVDHSVHRTAAAKLRGEPLRFSSMVMYDLRASQSEQQNNPQT